MQESVIKMKKEGEGINKAAKWLPARANHGPLERAGILPIAPKSRVQVLERTPLLGLGLV